MPLSAPSGVVELKPDPGRIYIRLPTILLAGAIGVALLTCVASIAGLHRFRPGTASGALRVALLCAIPLGYIRALYPNRTRLRIDGAGISLSQPFAAWTVAWDQLATINVTSPFDVTHKGGIAAGLKLNLRDGTSRHIPDVFAVKRAMLQRSLIETQIYPSGH